MSLFLKALELKLMKFKTLNKGVNCLAPRKAASNQTIQVQTEDDNQTQRIRESSGKHCKTAMLVEKSSRSFGFSGVLWQGPDYFLLKTAIFPISVFLLLFSMKFGTELEND